MSVFHSLVIPTRNRQKYINDAVTYYLRGVDNLGEVIVADNSDNKELILKYLKPHLYDRRLKILASPAETLSMRNNWERGISVTKGEWVSFIGDDDILSPDLVLFLKSIANNNPNVTDLDCVKWRHITFSWKGVDVDGRRHNAMIPIEGDRVRKFNSRPYLDNLLKWNLPQHTMGSGPSIYHGVWKRSLINKIKELNNGIVFDAETVDYDAGYNALFCTENFIILERPFSIMGASEESNSAAVFDYERKDDMRKKWIEESGRIDGLPSGISMPNSITLTVYFLNKYWMKKHDHFIDVNKENVILGLAAEMKSCDPIFFDRFKEELIKFIKTTDLAEFLPVFKPEKRQKLNIGWNGLSDGKVIIDPTNYADRVIDFAAIAFSMLTPWQRVGTKYKVDTSDI